MEEDEIVWKRVKEDDRGLKSMKDYETEWKSMKED